MFRTVPLSIIRSFHCTHSNGTGFLKACDQDQDETAVSYWFCSQVFSKPVWHIPLLCVQWKTPDDGQRNCPKHVDFHFKNKFEKNSAFNWFYYKKFITMHDAPCTVTWTSNKSIYQRSRYTDSLTAYEPGLESQEWQGIVLFSRMSRPNLGPTQPLVQWARGLPPEGKAAGT
jgi:hypothetical protein